MGVDLLGLDSIEGQGPFTEDVLARVQRRHHHGMVQRDTYCHRHQVNLRRVHHLLIVPERQPSPSALLRPLGGLLVRRAHSDQFGFFQCSDSRQVGAGAPPVRPTIRAHYADAHSMLCHGLPLIFV
jgi:hypothetical protein